MLQGGEIRRNRKAWGGGEVYVISMRLGLSMHKLSCSTKVSQQFLIDGYLHVHVWRRSCPLNGSN